MEKEKQLEELLEKLEESLTNFYKNCPYQNKDAWKENRESFIKNLGKGYFYLCNNPERSYNCLRYINEVKKYKGEIEYYYPKELTDASIKHLERRGLSKEEIIGIQQTTMMAASIERAPHYCDSLMYLANGISNLIRMVREGIKQPTQRFHDISRL
jgi:hypothetical protein